MDYILHNSIAAQKQYLTLLYMGYFDYLFYMGGDKKAPRSNSGI